MKTVEQAMLDEEFRVILNTDPILDALEKEKYNPRDEYFALMSILSPVFRVSGVNVMSITPAAWSLLYCIQNAYAVPKKEITESDTDVFLYVLHNGLSGIDEGLVEKSFRFCEKNGLDYKEAKADLLRMIYVAFRPLEMCPPGNSGAEAMYDADWLTRICSVAAEMSGRDTRDIMHNMSLTEACYYYVQFRRRQDTKNEIRRRDSGEVCEAIYHRYMELGEAYHKEHYQESENGD